MKHHIIFQRIEKPKALFKCEMPESQIINKKNPFNVTCRCSCKDEVKNLTNGIRRLEKLASIQSKLINKIARRMNLVYDSEENYAPPVHTENLLNRKIFPITTPEGLLELDDLLQDQSLHEQVVSVSYCIES